MRFDISEPGVDVTRALESQKILSSKYPFWKCDMRPTPKHYGVIIASVTLSMGDDKEVFSLRHGYIYQPTFLMAWDYPPGTSIPDQTFGVGSFQLAADSGVYSIKGFSSRTRFYIQADAFGSGPTKTIDITLRYFVFADDFADSEPGLVLAS